MGLCTANITVKNNRVKVYNDNSVYLKSGQEFEIELFNGNTSTVLAKISINGKQISNSGPLLAEVLKADKIELETLWLADQIFAVIKDEKLALKAMHIAEEEVKFHKSK